MSTVKWDSLPGIPLEMHRATDLANAEEAQRRVEAILRSGSAELLQSVREAMRELGNTLCQDVRREIRHFFAECNTTTGRKDDIDSLREPLRVASRSSPRASAEPVHTVQVLQEPFVACDANTVNTDELGGKQASFGPMEDLTPNLIKSDVLCQDKLAEYGLDPIENGDLTVRSWEAVEADSTDRINQVGCINHEIKSWAWGRDSHSQQSMDGVMQNGGKMNGKQTTLEDSQEAHDDPEDSRTMMTEASSSTRSWQEKKSVRSYGHRMSITFSEKIVVGFEEVGAFGRSVQYLVRHPGFDYIMGLVLLCNAAWLGVQVDFMAREKRDKRDPPTLFRVVDIVFCILFVVELVLRILCYRWQFLRVKGWQWNLFDIIVVTFQLADEITKLAVRGGQAQEIFDNMGVLRLMRLGRIVRLIRMVRLIPELKSMVYLISASMQSFFWTMTLLMILIYCVSIFFTENAMDIASKASQDTRGSIDQYWGSIPRAAQSLFQAISGGDDWENFLSPLRAESPVINVLVFSLYIAFASLVMLNLVTGVFVEGAQRIVRKDKDQEFKTQINKLFFDTDENNDMKISEQEFLHQLESSMLDEFFDTIDLSREQARVVFKLLDTDEDHGLDIEEFVKGCLRLRGPARSVDLSTFLCDFREFKRQTLSTIGKVDKHVNQLMSEIRRVTRRMPQGRHAGGLLRPPSIA